MTVNRSNAATIRRKLRLARKQGLGSQSAIAKLARVDRSRLSLFENGHVELSDVQLESVGRAIDHAALLRVIAMLRAIARNE